ncbi:MAG: hypothetical protein U0Z44_09505 [Kouleothrix sp.]
MASSRAEIERYRAAHGLVPQHDPSNHDLSATRNRIRHELIPHLIDYNPHIVAALGRTARICAEQHEFLEASARRGLAWAGAAAGRQYRRRWCGLAVRYTRRFSVRRCGGPSRSWPAAIAPR